MFFWFTFQSAISDWERRKNIQKQLYFWLKTFSLDNVDEEREKKDFENMRELNVLLRNSFSGEV